MSAEEGITQPNKLTLSKMMHEIEFGSADSREDGEHQCAGFVVISKILWFLLGTEPVYGVYGQLKDPKVNASQLSCTRIVIKMPLLHR